MGSWWNNNVAWTMVRELFEAVLSKYGPGFVVLVLVIIYLFRIYERAHRRLINQLQAEIERLVQERNWYQDTYIERRLTSMKNEAPGKTERRPTSEGDNGRG